MLGERWTSPAVAATAAARAEGARVGGGIGGGVLRAAGSVLMRTASPDGLHKHGARDILPGSRLAPAADEASTVCGSRDHMALGFAFASCSPEASRDQHYKLRRKQTRLENVSTLESQTCMPVGVSHEMAMQSRRCHEGKQECSRTFAGAVAAR